MEINANKGNQRETMEIKEQHKRDQRTTQQSKDDACKSKKHTDNAWNT